MQRAAAAANRLANDSREAEMAAAAAVLIDGLSLGERSKGKENEEREKAKAKLKQQTQGAQAAAQVGTFRLYSKKKSGPAQRRKN